MARRREFPVAVKKTVVKRATKASVIYCEKCGLPAKKWQIDHVIADSHGGKPVIENAELICEICFGEKNPKDTTIAAKLKRQEAAHLRIATPTRNPIPAPAPRAPAPKASKMVSSKPPVVDRGSLYARYGQKDASQ